MADIVAADVGTVGGAHADAGPNGRGNGMTRTARIDPSGLGTVDIERVAPSGMVGVVVGMVIWTGRSSTVRGPEVAHPHTRGCRPKLPHVPPFMVVVGSTYRLVRTVDE
ncbi:hypothetical protein BP5796_09825 [Coleophoma crateriformis]|uniref:Uncharacterized protein n=1 Tax=Coleophoma crateriformis TaxID=565419 RepID=A0A3D8QZ49_9HELO|nr:hypothetical protein BP5796_09825 [Coleophoma crateriformis]